MCPGAVDILDCQRATEVSLEQRCCLSTEDVPSLQLLLVVRVGILARPGPLPSMICKLTSHHVLCV